MYAAERGCYEFLTLTFDAEACSVDNEGKTATLYACQVDSYNCLSITFSKEFDHRDNNGAGLLHYAA